MRGDVKPALSIVPAIDLRGGKCVRLLYGDPARETRYDGDPVDRARDFVRAGARRLHVVDLDGAFGTGENLAALRAICAAVDVPVQTGGGVRDEAGVRARLAAGAGFVILGTLLIEAPDEARALVERYGPRIVAGVDVRGRDVAVRGWQSEGGVERDALLGELLAWGVERVVVTEISRDGAGTGYAFEALAEAATRFPMAFTASGGARDLSDLRALRAATPANVDQAIVGRALYEGTLDLGETLAAFAAP
jgi:phosphoribosylformimino-5-aminoimidazole carboxamide ribotide isomerase